MAWWLTSIQGTVWAPSVDDFKHLPAYKQQAHRLFMAGKTYQLLRGVL